MSTSVPTLPDTEFHRAFAARIRETVAPEHGRTPDAAPVFEPGKIQRVAVEEATLTPGSVILFKQYGDLLRVAFDPARLDRATAAALLGQRFGDRVERLATETARTWSIRTTTGATVTGYLPEWAETDPSRDGVRNDRLEVHVVDVHHRRDYDGPTVTVDMPGFDKDRYVGEYQILAPVMRCMPHADDPADRVPVVMVDAMPGSDHYIGPLDPAGVLDLADKLRAHADALDDVAALLQDARDDWARNGGAR